MHGVAKATRGEVRRRTYSTAPARLPHQALTAPSLSKQRARRHREPRPRAALHAATLELAAQVGPPGLNVQRIGEG